MLFEGSNKTTCLFVIGTILIWVPRLANAQLSSSVFEDFTQITYNNYLINPTAADTSYNYNVRANNINELGFRKNVYRYYLDLDKKFSSNTQGYHFLGLQVINSRHGSFINGSRLSIRYSWVFEISKKALLASGVSFGFINYSFASSQGGAGGTDYGPDGSIGIRYMRSKFSAGLAMQQIFSPTLTPISQSFEFDKLINLDLVKRITVSPHLYIQIISVMQFSESQTGSYSLGFDTRFMRKGIIGLNTFSFSESSALKTSLNLGVQNLSIRKNRLQIVCTYSFFHNGIPTPDNVIEIFLSLKK